MWLFFRLRFAFWVAAGLPVSFLGGLFFLAAIGYSINMITMVALLLALGLLMDDAIVISENIASHLQRGKSSLEAALDGTREVVPGVFASFSHHRRGVRSAGVPRRRYGQSAERYPRGADHCAQYQFHRGVSDSASSSGPLPAA